MLAGIIRTFLTTSLAGSLVLGGVALTAIHNPTSTLQNQNLEAARAMTFVTSGQAFPLLVRDAQAIAQLRDIIQTLDTQTPTNKAIQQSLADFGIQIPSNEPDLIAQARHLLEKSQHILISTPISSSEPGLNAAQSTLNQINALLIHKSPG